MLLHSGSEKQFSGPGKMLGFPMPGEGDTLWNWPLQATGACQKALAVGTPTALGSLTSLTLQVGKRWEDTLEEAFPVLFVMVILQVAIAGEDKGLDGLLVWNNMPVITSIFCSVLFPFFFGLRIQKKPNP